MESGIRNRSRICPVPPGSRTGLNLDLRPKPIFMAVSLVFILITYGLMMGPAPTLPVISHESIAIDGDVNFLDTALLEEWPGDGSPENPYIIDRLNIDLGGANGRCISISNTRVSFIISNCNLTGANYGICLENVINGEIVDNTCSSNYVGIFLYESNSNTLTDNTCTDNGDSGISFYHSDFNIIVNNTCNNNKYAGIYSSWGSRNNTVVNNTCSSNLIHGIHLLFSDFTITTDNTCF
ncbi:MAG: right-handed parallel beta-helix repeat-containing protein, partial [Candidatus Thorarchaeota archaeon]